MAGPGGGPNSNSLGLNFQDDSSNLLGTYGGPALAGGALLYDLFKGNETDPNITSLQGLSSKLGDESQNLFTQGQTFENYLTSGTLPTGLQNKLNLAEGAAKARVVQGAANSGLSADPTKNSAVAQDLSSVDIQGSAAMADEEVKLAQLGQSMIGQGIQLAGLQSNLYQFLANYDQKQQQQVGDAITNFAKALGTFGSKAALFA